MNGHDQGLKDYLL